METDMAEKVILPESLVGSDKMALERLMALLSPEDRSDIKLRRFLIFRMKIDGEDVTKGYILRKLEDILKKGFSGSFYEFVGQGMGSDMELSDKQPPDETG
jgi:hypothetical protein